MKGFMKAVWRILRRELRAQFASPTGYIYIIVFLTVTTALYLFLPPFFAFPTADMSGFFGWVIPVLCVFAPAATMRIWAEERKENTIEMLLTFPMSAPALVLGKFLGALVFYLAALASTFMIPLMLVWLGDPDGGPIVSGYLGATLVGAFFIALGMFVSGFCRDQVTAFVVSFLACGLTAIFGWNAFGTILEGTLGGLGVFLRNVLGMTGHYVPFTRGIIELADVLFFLAWTALFLFLNGAYLEGRSRPGVVAKFGGTAALGVLVGVLFNATIGGTSIARFDVTEGNIYTVSQAAKDILKRLRVPVRATFYVSPQDKMPAELGSLERDVVDKLREMSVASRGKLELKVIHMEAANVLKEPEEDEEGGEAKDDKKKSLEERLIDKGVRPFSVRALREDQATTQLIYASIGLAYKEKEEEFIPQVMPQSLAELEYRIMSIVFKLTREKAPVVALVAPYEDIQIPRHMMQIYMQMGQMPPKRDDPYIYLERLLEHEKFEVKRVKLTKAEPLPDEYDALVIVDPQEFDERQRWEIGRAVVSGKPTLMAVQNYRWNYSIGRRSASVSKRDVKPGVNELLDRWGVTIDERILMDSNHEPLTISNPANPLEQIFGGGMTLNLPTHIAVNPASMNADVSITNRIERIFYLWGSCLKLDEEKAKENKLDVTTLFSSSDGAWTVPATGAFSETRFDPPEETEQYPLAVMVKGTFPDAFAGRGRPPWRKESPGPQPPGAPPEYEEDEGPPPEAVTPAPGQVVLVGCAEMFSRSFLTRGNLDFFMNCIDTMTLGEELIHIRAKKPIDRTIDKPSAAARTFWKFVDLGLVSALVVAAGVARMVLARRSRERYYASLKRAA